MLRVMAAVVLASAVLCAQAPDVQAIAAQFGPGFKADPSFPVLVADLDGDGKEDAVVVARSEDPLRDEAAFRYKVIDPFNAYFGFADPKTTSRFITPEQDPRLVLVIHNWRAPQQKFVIINLPFQKLSLSRVRVKKKSLPAIGAQEITGFKSDIYWDGKKWRWKEEGLD
jgi:hypothetical protein